MLLVTFAGYEDLPHNLDIILYDTQAGDFCAVDWTPMQVLLMLMRTTQTVLCQMVSLIVQT